MNPASQPANGGRPDINARCDYCLIPAGRTCQSCLEFTQHPPNGSQTTTARWRSLDDPIAIAKRLGIPVDRIFFGRRPDGTGRLALQVCIDNYHRIGDPEYERVTQLIRNIIAPRPDAWHHGDTICICNKYPCPDGGLLPLAQETEMIFAAHHAAKIATAAPAPPPDSQNGAAGATQPQLTQT